MSIYTASFSAVAISAAQDVFDITAPATSRVRIREVRIGQYTDFGDAAAEIISVQFIRGFTTVGTGGTTATSYHVSGHSTPLASTTVVKVNNTTVAQDGTGVVLWSDVWNIATPYIFAPTVPAPRQGWWGEHFVLAASQRLVIRITVPADPLTCNGTVIYEQMGHGGGA